MSLTSPTIKIASLTVTEKGYCHNPSTGELDLTHPDIQHDLANPDAPKTVFGYLATALKRRRDARLRQGDNVHIAFRHDKLAGIERSRLLAINFGK